MAPSDTSSVRSVVTQASRNSILRWREIEDGMLGRAEHSIRHPVVTALTSVITNIAPGSVLHRDMEGLEANKGKYRPFIVVRKPRGHGRPARIVLVTHFDGRPISELDECTKTLAVALGTATPPYPLPTSERILIDPEWTEQNSYAIAFAINLEHGRHPKRYRAKGKEYNVNTPELELLRAVCVQRTAALESMSDRDLESIKTSYEEHVTTYRPPSSRRGSQFGTRSRITNLAPIREDDQAMTQSDIPEVDEDGFILAASKKKRR